MHIVEFRNITKRFDDVVANDRINLQIQPGRIHALLGENGSGKSTLMKILYGLYDENAGEIFVRGEQMKLKSPQQAIDQGIYMIHQNFMLVPQMTVLENVISGHHDNRNVLDYTGSRTKVVEIGKRFGLKVDPSAFVHQLSVGECQRVEIIKALYRGAEILILDEPTAVLTPQETTELLRILKNFVAEGMTIIFITHKLEEVVKFADVCTVLRNGKVVDTVEVEGVSKPDLARMMVGRDVVFRVDREKVPLGEVVVDVDNVSAKNDYGRQVLAEISFQIREGEILGIAGVDGNGQLELSEALTGLMRVDTGTIQIDGSDVTNRSVKEIMEKGVAYVPAERNGVGCIPDFSVRDNFVLRQFHKEPFSRRTFFNREEVVKTARRLIDSYSIKVGNINGKACLLSGGNLQKVILSRELDRAPKMLVCVHPTRGLDVGAIENVQRLLLESRRYQTAILMISTELEEVLALSDRIAVMYEGRFMGILENDGSLDLEQVGLMMAGVDVNEKH